MIESSDCGRDCKTNNHGFEQIQEALSIFYQSEKLLIFNSAGVGRLYIFSNKIKNCILSFVDLFNGVALKFELSELKAQKF